MNTLSISDIHPTIANPYNLSGERYVGYGEEEYHRERKLNPNIPKPDIDYLNGGRYLAPGFPYNLGNNPFEEKDMIGDGCVTLDNGESIAVLNTDHFIVLNGKRYRIANLENGKRILLDSSIYQERGRTVERHNSTWEFKRLSGKQDNLEIWSDEFWIGKHSKNENGYNLHGWNAKFYDNTFGVVYESGHKEILIPLIAGPKNIDRILGVTKVKGEIREIEALIGDESGIPIGIAQVQRDTLKFTRMITEITYG